VLQTLVAQLQRLAKVVELSNQTLHVEIIGHTDSSGTEHINRRLGQKRADKVLQFLLSSGLLRTQLAAVSVGTDEPVTKEVTEPKGVGL
jgi:OOP family OmpA-OmpF porin